MEHSSSLFHVYIPSLLQQKKNYVLIRKPIENELNVEKNI